MRELQHSNGMAEEFRVGVETRVYNGTLRDAITASGLNVQAVAKALGVTYQRVLDWLKFAAYPTEEQRLRAAIFFSISDEVLFPPELAGVRVRDNRVRQRLSLDEFKALSNSALMLGPAPLEAIEDNVALTAALDAALGTLRPKERDVLLLRFREGLSYDQVGQRVGVSKARIYQIEAKALRKLRHPSRAKGLRAAWQGYESLQEQKELEAYRAPSGLEVRRLAEERHNAAMLAAAAPEPALEPVPPAKPLPIWQEMAAYARQAKLRRQAQDGGNAE